MRMMVKMKINENAAKTSTISQRCIQKEAILHPPVNDPTVRPPTTVCSPAELFT